MSSLLGFPPPPLEALVLPPGVSGVVLGPVGEAACMGWNFVL